MTDANGEINIYNIKAGTYTVKEVSVGDNYGYDIDDNYIFWDNGTQTGTGSEGQIQVDRETSTATTDTNVAEDENEFTIMTFKNRRKYIKLSGFVWEDMISGKTSERDWRYSQGDSDETNPDKLVANVSVRLKNSEGGNVKFKTENGEEETEILTDENGNYKMFDILIDELDKYYIQFEYNGMSYTSVPIVDLLPETVNSSKAKENNDERTTFNNNYSTITYDENRGGPTGVSLNEQGMTMYNLLYDEIPSGGDYGVSSKINYGPSGLYGYEGQKFPINRIDYNYMITATTKDAYQEAGKSGYLSDLYTAEAIRSGNIQEITNINLGLWEREQPDLAVVEDIESAKITLNGYEHTYKYNQRFDENGESDGFNVGVKFANEYGSQSYTRTIYSSDVVYNLQEGNEGKLEVYITYKVALRNEATNVCTKVNEIANYFDSRYDINSIITESGQTLSYSEPEEAGNGFKKVKIKTNQNIDGQKQKLIYITYKLQNDAINAVLNSQITLNSVTEITSYSSYVNNNYIIHYAGIDIDSRPGSAKPNDKNTYEDDTDSAPSLILELQEGRFITGTVWEDNAIDTLLAEKGSDKERKGNGLYDNGENILKGVNVELLSCDENGNIIGNALIYDKELGAEGLVPIGTTTTNELGEYTISGVIPGKYALRFTYGNSSVIVTPDVVNNEIGQVEKYKSTIYRKGNKEEAENTSDYYWYVNDTERMSDARDVYASKNGTEYDVVEDRISDKTYTYGIIQNEENPESVETITADTKTFEINMDYDVNNDKISEYGADLKFVFDNIDFGIIRRPIQNVEVRKEIAHVQVRLANGQIIIDGDPRDGNIQYLKYLPDGNVHIELDQELMQGATLMVRYDVIVDNTNVEIDYNDEDYYVYGILPTNNKNLKIATISNLYDYVSNDLVLDEKNSDARWKKVEISQSYNEQLLSEDAYNAAKKFNQVLQTEAFAYAQPGQIISIPLQVSKILSNSSDDLIFTNDIEVNKVKGRKMEHEGKYTTPGNYIPSNGELEGDDDYVYVTITGPTGANQNYIPYIILGISSLIILVAGVVFIKKKVL